jgi:amidase
MVERLRRAGPIFIGKTNTPEFGLGSHTYNPVYGVTRNAYDQTRSAGGSSGGAAVSLALRMLPVADGSDYGGSLRNPAGLRLSYELRAGAVGCPRRLAAVDGRNRTDGANGR